MLKLLQARREIECCNQQLHRHDDVVHCSICKVLFSLSSKVDQKPMYFNIAAALKFLQVGIRI